MTDENSYQHKLSRLGANEACFELWSQELSRFRCLNLTEKHHDSENDLFCRTVFYILYTQLNGELKAQSSDSSHALLDAEPIKLALAKYLSEPEFNPKQLRYLWPFVCWYDREVLDTES